MLGAAVECGRALTHLTRHPILILRGGYKLFSAMYHFFRTQKIIWMPQASCALSTPGSGGSRAFPWGPKGSRAGLEKQEADDMEKVEEVLTVTWE